MADSTPSLCYPRQARLLRPQDFTALRGHAKRISLRHFSCEYRPTDAPTARLGMAVSRRVSKLAVVRNRIRRQIRESFRLHRARLSSCDILVIARSSSAQTANALLRVELAQLWEKLAAQPQAPIGQRCDQNEPKISPPLNALDPTVTMRPDP